MTHTSPNPWLMGGLLLCLSACGDTPEAPGPDASESTAPEDGSSHADSAVTIQVTADATVAADSAELTDSGAQGADAAGTGSDSASLDTNGPDSELDDMGPADAEPVDALSAPSDVEVGVEVDGEATEPPVDIGEEDTAEDVADVPVSSADGTTVDAGPDADDVDDEATLPFLESYGTVETLAGTAFFTAKALNGWTPDYEGGPALDAELSRPHMTQADAQGRLFIADKDAHAIRRVDLDGTIHTVAGTSEAGDGPDTLTLGTEVALHSPNGLWVRADGTVYILDLVNEKIRRLAPDGLIETFFVAGDLGSGRGLWVSDDEQLVWMSAGTVLKRWTPATGVQIAAEGFVSLGNLAVMSNGQLAVTDRGDNRAWWVGNSGAVMPLAGNGELTGGGDGFSALETGLGGLRGIWFPPDGGILLCAHSESKLFWVDTEGILHLMLDGLSDGTHGGDGEPWWTPGAKISEPRAVTMDYEGNILLTEHDGGFIRRILRTGPLP